MNVVIDGVKYAPANNPTSNIGIAISTHNRHEVLSRALEHHLKYLPYGALVVVIDDGSKKPVTVPDGVRLIRHDMSQGIVASKNASLEALMDAGCEQLFLWDDDAWPVAENWHQPYIDSPEPHLAYQFLDLAGPRKLRDMNILFQDAQHIAYTGQRGVMLYYHRSAVNKVGGFDPVYGRGMYEHPDLALRIHNAGLTSWAFADVVGSERLIHSCDEHETVDRSLPGAERQALVAKNSVIYSHRRDSFYTGYVEYRQQRNVVITTLLTSQPDPQRGSKMAATPDLLSKWAASVKSADAVVLVDELETAPAGATLHRVPDVAMNVYFRRWLHIYQHLRDHPEYRWVWCTDGTDVEMLHEPWQEMEPGKIYVGSEPKTYADAWAAANHPEACYQQFLTQHRKDLMLNAGLLGGSRAEVMAVAHGIVRLYYHIESLRCWKKEGAASAIGDMIAFAIVAHRYSDRLVTGPRVHTVFKSNGIGKDYAWWQHK
ncbi:MULTISPECIES: glycosyltransferase family 2 protein [Pantoea]|uniref:Glycosyltransferase family 2 protein n=1 Tax=Candidatus Pantoea gossypiicola TaxID=2608008 RepID=A0AB34CUW5_9GAMM|nr:MULTISPECIES: glycosyltransferase family 2 protein [Pantoea]KAA5961023.1 glycosyltransferase family 2 protein [Pantoea sp. VH_24]KAA5964436.1 glycosyltransferase family 2 protein [Pantoea sp. VH_16]KAA5968626.1 glycosyltransferase family 2 protein [Pantoea sp. VH_18]KAA6004307.1 glycosyltransferase family 2 protein [Pantoea sp. M_1]KAA6006791.1 glycosyltransferase family 2 protein [Pantoea sp. F_7]